MNIKKMLPFLEEDELNELAKKVTSSPDGVYEGVKFEDLLPFMDEDDLGARMIDEAKAGRDISPFAPFVDEDAFWSLLKLLEQGVEIKGLSNALPFLDEDEADRLLKLCLNHGGSISGVEAKDLLPFASDELMDSFFLKTVENNGSFGGLNTEALLPFASDDVIDQAFLLMAKKGSPLAEQYAPFASDDAFHQLAKDYLSGGCPNLDIETFYPFMDEDDIKDIFTHYLRSH